MIRRLDQNALRVSHRAAHEENRQSQREGMNGHGTWYFGLT
jgi:hypothetical protein